MIPKKRVPAQIAAMPASSTVPCDHVIVVADDGTWFRYWPNDKTFEELPDLPQPERPIAAEPKSPPTAAGDRAAFEAFEKGV